MPARLLLIRHGHADFTSRRFTDSPRGRQWDPPLDDRGREQAARLTGRLLEMDLPRAVLVSPFLRCSQTIQPYLDRIGRVPTLVEDLGEVFIGDWEGVPFEEIVAGDQELARLFKEREARFDMAPGGESGAALRARVVPAIQRGLENFDEGNILVVAHGGVINAYLGHIMGVSHDMFFFPDNASICTVIADGERQDVRFLNDVRHLAGASAGPIASPPPGRKDETNLRVGILPRYRAARRRAGWPSKRQDRKEDPVGVKFLTDEWCQAVQNALNSNDAFKSAAASQAAKVQQVVTGEGGEQKYWFKLDGGAASLGMGDSPEPVDATITQDYETAVALAKNELTGTAAYMSGKLRVSGDLMKLMQLQGALGQMPVALQDVEVDY